MISVNLNFGKFSQSEECQTIIKKNRISAHVESGDNFFDNSNSQENIFDLCWHSKIMTKIDENAKNKLMS